MSEYTYALDLSLNSTGVCIFTNDGKFIKAITIKTGSKDESKQKLRTIGDEFVKMIKKYPPKTVVIEQGFTRYNLSTQALFKVHGVASYIFSDYEQIYYPASAVKKLIGGNGNINKKELRDAISKKYPDITFETPDESDAFALGITFFLQKGIL